MLVPDSQVPAIPDKLGSLVETEQGLCSLLHPVKSSLLRVLQSDLGSEGRQEFSHSRVLVDRNCSVGNLLGREGQG